MPMEGILMLKIAICDDNALLCTQLETALAQVQQTLEEKWNTN